MKYKLPDKYIAVVGLGQTGISILNYFQRKGETCVAFDTRENPPNIDAIRQRFPDVTFVLGELPFDRLNQAQEIIFSPGVPVPPGISAIGDIEIFARENTVPVIAITGTNGKSTVTALIAHVAKTCGLNVKIGGNFGIPALNLLDEKDLDLIVLELSSFQLEITQSLSPLAATILNITPDHLDRHESFDEYVKAKQKIYQGAQNGVFNLMDPLTFPQLDIPSFGFSLNEPNDHAYGLLDSDGDRYIALNEDLIVAVNDLPELTNNFILNTMAALGLLHSFHFPLFDIRKALASFKPLEHRLERFAVLDEVEWFNDSKATNIGAVKSAILSVAEKNQGKIILIAGGRSKGEDYRLLKSDLSLVGSVILIGETKDELAMLWDDCIKVSKADNLSDAIAIARSQASPGDSILFSPACSSFDMFENYIDRGLQFKRLVLEQYEHA